MSATKKILVAVDFSKYSLKITEYACQLAEDLDAELLFVNVINQRDVDMVKNAAAYIDKLSVKKYISDLRKNRSEDMDNLLDEITCPSIPSRFMIKTGVPFLELIKTAEEEQVDMVVMGTRGRGNISDIFHGSQAEKMYRHCPVPLLSISVRNKQKEKRL
jgi:nucleotide-binding universal stress UspA family protein